MNLVTADEAVVISKKVYERLVERSLTLARLEAAGVDNWEGYPCGDPDEDFDDEE